MHYYIQLMLHTAHCTLLMMLICLLLLILIILGRSLTTERGTKWRAKTKLA